MGLGAQPQQEHFAIYTLICLWKQYFQLLNWHKIVTYIIILTFFLENCWFNHKLAPLMPHVIIVKDHPHHLTKHEGKKFQFSNFFVNWQNLEIRSKLFKNSNFPSLYELRKTWKYAQPQTNISKSKCWIYGWAGKTYVLI